MPKMMAITPRKRSAIHPRDRTSAKRFSMNVAIAAIMGWRLALGDRPLVYPRVPGAQCPVSLPWALGTGHWALRSSKHQEDAPINEPTEQKRHKPSTPLPW